MSKKIFLSGVQPSGKPHIGNYFGAMKQFVDLQNEYDGYALIVDYHALHSLRNPKEMSENIKNVLLDYLAIGLDPKKVTIFKQSDVSEHTELTWIFDTITTMPFLMRAHAFKAVVAKNGADRFLNRLNSYDEYTEGAFTGIDVGTFNYPVLMAGDILLYKGQAVPVGKDQEQHVELARTIAKKFNQKFGKVFDEPETILPKVGSVSIWVLSTKGWK